MSNVPNLDAMTGDELAAFLTEYGSCSRTHAAKLVGKRKGYTSVANSVVNYAANKNAAIYCRLRGDIVQAMNYETICERLYQALPADIRW